MPTCPDKYDAAGSVLDDTGAVDLNKCQCPDKDGMTLKGRNKCWGYASNVNIPEDADVVLAFKTSDMRPR